MPAFNPRDLRGRARYLPDVDDEKGCSYSNLSARNHADIPQIRVGITP